MKCVRSKLCMMSSGLCLLLLGPGYRHLSYRAYHCWGSTCPLQSLARAPFTAACSCLTLGFGFVSSPRCPVAPPFIKHFGGLTPQNSSPLESEVAISGNFYGSTEGVPAVLLQTQGQQEASSGAKPGTFWSWLDNDLGQVVEP